MAMMVILISIVSGFLSGEEVVESRKNKRKKDNGEAEDSALWMAFKDMLAENVPVESAKELRPKFYLYAIGAGSFITMFAVFVYYFIVIYVRYSTSSFVSLSPNSGTCKAITKSIVGSFVADSNGVWSGAPDFRFSEGLYELIATELTWTDQEYQELIDVFVDQLHIIGQVAEHSDLAANIALVMSWQMLCPAEIEVCQVYKDQYFVFTGSSQYIFDLSHIHASFSYSQGDCLVSSYTNYNLASAHNMVSMSYNEFISSPICNATINPTVLGYDPAFQQTYFQIGMDVRTFGDSVGINRGALPVLDIEVVTNSAAATRIVHNNNTYVGDYYIDPYYNGMKPLFCLYNEDNIDLALGVPPIAQRTADGTGVVQICFIILGDDVVSLPLFHHYGASGVDGSIHEPTKSCFCDQPSANDPACDLFNFMSSYVFHPGVVGKEAQISRLLDMVVQAGGFDKLSRSAYNASFASASAVFVNNTDPIMQTEEWRNNSYAFCNQSCSLLVINSFGDTLTDQSMTEYMYTFTNGSCNDAFSTSQLAQDNMHAYLPTVFTERYYECVMTSADAINASIGLASGNATTIVPIAFFLLLPLLYIYLHLTDGFRHNDSFSDKEIRNTNKTLMWNILRTRDALRKEAEEGGDAVPDSPLTRLVLEMNRLQESHHGEVDSDDSDDEAGDDNSESIERGEGSFGSDVSNEIMKNNEKEEEEEEEMHWDGIYTKVPTTETTKKMNTR